MYKRQLCTCMRMCVHVPWLKLLGGGMPRIAPELALLRNPGTAVAKDIPAGKH